MNWRATLTTLALATLLAAVWPSPAYAQLGGPRELRRISNSSPDEIISMSSSLSFRDAMTVFSELSSRQLNKVIVDPESRSTPINVDVNNMHWLDAFELVLRENNLWYEEYPDHILVVEKGRSGVSEEVVSNRQMWGTREVMITAVFFELNRSKLRQMGSDWNFFNAEGTMNSLFTAANNKPSLFQFELSNSYSFGDILGIFQVLENEQAGEIIASPKVSVRSGKKGRVQIGSDYSITTKDFAGNTVTQFFSTGSIIEVTPEIITLDSVSFIHLELSLERSSAQASGELGTEIQKSAAETFLLMLDQEETLIGGLRSVENTETREGIPFLKDLPWWFFGLRYVFGFETTQQTQQELMILLKAELLPTLGERLEAKRQGLVEPRNRLLEQKLRELRDEQEFYRSQNIYDPGYEEPADSSTAPESFTPRSSDP